MQWKCVKSFNGLYEVSDTGLVRSMPRKILYMNRIRNSKITILKPNIDKDGYICCTLRGNGFTKTYKVHRLVMMCFVGESALCVNHKDCNKKNNNLNNLEYVTVKENNIHARRNIRFKPYNGPSHHSYKLSIADKEEILSMYRSGTSVNVIGKKFNIHPHTVYKIKSLHHRQSC